MKGTLELGLAHVINNYPKGRAHCTLPCVDDEIPLTLSSI